MSESETTEITATIAASTFESYVFDITRCYTESSNIVHNLRGDLLFLSKIAYRQPMSSSCASISYESLKLVSKTLEEVLASKRLTVMGLDEINKNLTRRELNMDNYNFLANRVNEDLKLLLAKTERKLAKAKLLEQYGKRQNVQKMAYTIAEMLETRYPTILTRFTELKRIISIFLDSIKRELEYIVRHGENAISYQRKKMDIRPLTYESDEEDSNINIVDPTVALKKKKVQKKSKASNRQLDEEEQNIEEDTTTEENKTNENEDVEYEGNGIEIQKNDIIAKVQEMFVTGDSDEEIDDIGNVGKNLEKLANRKFNAKQRKKVESLIHFIKEKQVSKHTPDKKIVHLKPFEKIRRS